MVGVKPYFTINTSLVKITKTKNYLLFGHRPQSMTVVLIPSLVSYLLVTLLTDLVCYIAF